MSGSVRKETNGTYTFQFRYKDSTTGQRKNKKGRGYPSKRAAGQAMRRLQVEFEKLGSTRVGGLKVEDFLRLWLDQHCADKASNTSERYRNAVHKHLIPMLGDLEIKRLDGIRIERFLRAKLETGLADETVNGFYRVLNTALKAAKRWRYINHNPCEDIPAPKVAQKEIVIIPLEDQKTIFSLLHAEGDGDSTFSRRHGSLSTCMNSTLFYLGMMTGARRSEIAALKFSDFDEDLKILHIRRTFTHVNGTLEIKEPKSKHGYRQIELQGELLDHIAKHRKEVQGLRNQYDDQWNQEGWLFVNPEGEPLSPRGLNKRFSGLLKRANLHLKGYGIHTMRHTHISELLMTNVPMFVVSRRAGHSSISVTVDRYGHIISTLGDDMVELHLKSMHDVWKSAIV